MAAKLAFEGLEIFDDTAFDAKLRRFGAAGLGSVHAVFDTSSWF